MPRRRPKPAPVSHCRIVMLNATIKVNGKVHQLAGVDYRCDVMADGTVVETGRPPGLPEGASVGDVIGAAFRLLEAKKKGGRRGK